MAADAAEYWQTNEAFDAAGEAERQSNEEYELPKEGYFEYDEGWFE